MIHLLCPHCQKKLRIQDAAAGKQVLCPACQHKLRVPQHVEDDDADPPEERITTRPARKPSPPPLEDEEEEREEEDRPRRRPRPADATSDEDEEPARSRALKRKKKRRRQQTSGRFAGADPFVVTMIGLAGLGLVLLVLGLIWPALSVGLVGLGQVVAVIGSIWFLIVAFQDDAMQGVLCFLCGIYGLYYLITHFEEEKRPFFLSLLGWALSIAGGVIAARYKP